MTDGVFIAAVAVMSLVILGIVIVSAIGSIDAAEHVKKTKLRALELVQNSNDEWMSGYELVGRLADDMLDGDFNFAKRLIDELCKEQKIERGTEPGKTLGLYRLRPA